MNQKRNPFQGKGQDLEIEKTIGAKKKKKQKEIEVDLEVFLKNIIKIPEIKRYKPRQD